VTGLLRNPVHEARGPALEWMLCETDALARPLHVGDSSEERVSVRRLWETCLEAADRLGLRTASVLVAPELAALVESQGQRTPGLDSEDPRDQEYVDAVADDARLA